MNDTPEIQLAQLSQDAQESLGVAAAADADEVAQSEPVSFQEPQAAAPEADAVEQTAEASDGAQKVALAEDAELVADDVTYEDLPKITFPVRFQIPLDRASAGHTGEIGGIKFVNGVTVDYHPHRVVNGFSAGFCAVIDVDTGVEISPLREGRAYTVDWPSKMWNYGQPLPAGKDFKSFEAPPPVEPPAAATAEVAASDADGQPVQTVAEVIAEVLKQKGARYLRQVCQARGLPTARAGEDMAATLAANLTLEEAKGL